MLIAPFSVSPSIRSPHVADWRATGPQWPTGMLLAWLIAGLAVLLCVPAARGGGALGATLPFWLIAAPAINLAWIERHRIAHRAVTFLRTFSRRRAPTRNVRRQRSCNAARSYSS